jgi:hypothetical protein
MTYSPNSASIAHPALNAARETLADGTTAGFFFGYNDTVGTSWEDIHPMGGDMPWETTATTIEVLSSDAADTSAGLGLRSVEVHGLSATGADQEEIIVMNGTTAVVSSLTYIRVNQVHAETAGTYGGSHQGDITIRVSGGGTMLAQMTGHEGSVDTSVQYGTGETSNGHWSVPLGKVMYITALEVITDISGTKTIDVALYEREDILDTTVPVSPRRILWQETGVNSNIEKSFSSYIKIKPLADIWFRAKGTSTSKIEVAVDYFMVNENASGT